MQLLKSLLIHSIVSASKYLICSAHRSSTLAAFLFLSSRIAIFISDVLKGIAKILFSSSIIFSRFEVFSVLLVLPFVDNLIFSYISTRKSVFILSVQLLQ